MVGALWFAWLIIGYIWTMFFSWKFGDKVQTISVFVTMIGFLALTIIGFIHAFSIQR